MHPGPMNRGVEIADDVADLPQSLVLRQVSNGVAVRMAVLFMLLGQVGRGAPRRVWCRRSHRPRGPTRWLNRRLGLAGPRTGPHRQS